MFEPDIKVEIWPAPEYAQEEKRIAYVEEVVLYEDKPVSMWITEVPEEDALEYMFSKYDPFQGSGKLFEQLERYYMAEWDLLAMEAE